MSIKVESTGIDQGAALSEPAAAKPVETQSAPAARAAEQTESTASDTAETEAKESEADESEDDASDEDVEAKESTESEDDKPKKKSGSQRRKERAERAEAEVARLQKLVEEMALKGAGESKADPKVEPKKPAAGDAEPDPDQYETHREYVRALADWAADQKLKERDQQSHKKTLEIEQAKSEQAHFDRVKVFKEKTEDYEDVLAEVGTLPISPAFESLLLSSENGPELLYTLAKDPAEFARVAALPHGAVHREIGRIEARLAAKPSEAKSEPKKTTKAPKPIDPVGGKSGSGEKSIYDPDISQAEYERLRAKQRTA